MIRKLMWNDILHNRLLSAVTTVFMAASALLLALTVLLFSTLLGAIDHLMNQAKTPDFLQMHSGEINQEEIRQFTGKHSEITEWQISRFLNLENSSIRLGDYQLADSTQDNGLCVQGEKFDYLLDMQNRLPEVSRGEVYVPVCYRSLYDLHRGDTMQIGSFKLTIAGFVRDSQMNSMMSSSKRFLVNEEDYLTIKSQGEEEYLIEFLLKEGADSGVLSTAYANEGLPANGPTITRPLIRMMNALSDGMMIVVIFLVGVVVLLISLLCIHFILALGMEKDKKETGMLKALGIDKKQIRRLYFAKYILLSVLGALAGLLAACLLKKTFVQQMQELYGNSPNEWQTGILSILAVIVIEGIILLSIRHSLKKTEKLSALEGLFPEPGESKKKGRGQYLLVGFVVAACAFLVLVPQNLYSTLSSPKFVTYMGIGDGEIRIDVRQTEDILQETQKVAAKLEKDARVEKYTVLQTRTYPAFSEDGTKYNLTVETGDHTVFPVNYVKGTAPENDKELALSSLNAEELNLSVGDSLQLLDQGKKVTYRICGIYSDITNGGKTAKAGVTPDVSGQSIENTPVMWSILYVSLKPSVIRKNWIDEYNSAGIKAVDIADYTAETYGQTLQEIKLASKMATGASLLIIFVVVTLFMRLIIERNRYSISLQKALGFTKKDITKIYMIKGLLSALAGTAGGLVTGSILGQSLCGMILKSFGADGFQFVPSWEKVLLLIPAVLLITAGVSTRIGIREIRNIAAYECCSRKE